MGKTYRNHIDGKWVEWAGKTIGVLNPATDKPIASVPLGDRHLRSTRWNVVATIFWDGQFDKFNWTGNLATELKGTVEVKGTPRPGDIWSLNNRFG